MAAAGPDGKPVGPADRLPPKHVKSRQEGLLVEWKDDTANYYGDGSCSDSDGSDGSDKEEEELPTPTSRPLTKRMRETSRRFWTKGAKGVASAGDQRLLIGLLLLALLWDGVGLFRLAFIVEDGLFEGFEYVRDFLWGLCTLLLLINTAVQFANKDSIDLILRQMNGGNWANYDSGGEASYGAPSDIERGASENYSNSCGDEKQPLLKSLRTTKSTRRRRWCTPCRRRRRNQKDTCVTFSWRVFRVTGFYNIATVSLCNLMSIALWDMDGKKNWETYFGIVNVNFGIIAFVASWVFWRIWARIFLKKEPYEDIVSLLRHYCCDRTLLLALLFGGVVALILWFMPEIPQWVIKWSLDISATLLLSWFCLIASYYGKFGKTIREEYSSSGSDLEAGGESEPDY